MEIIHGDLLRLEKNDMESLNSFEVEKINFYKDRVNHAIAEIWFCEEKLFGLLRDHCEYCNSKGECWNDRFSHMCIVNDHCINRKENSNLDRVKQERT